MSGSLPSFVKLSEKYEDLFRDDDDLMLVDPVIDATPIFQAVVPPVRTDSFNSDKRRLSCGGGSLGSTSETRSSKKPRTAQPPAVPQDIQQFYQMVGGQIPIDVVYGLCKQKSSDVARSMLYLDGESFFHQLRLGGQLAAATRGDVRPREEMKKVKTDLEASDKERHGLLEANKKLKGEVASLTKEKETLSRLASSQDKEKEGLVASHAAREASLKAKLESLQGTLDKYKEALQEKYWKRITNGARSPELPTRHMEKDA